MASVNYGINKDNAHPRAIELIPDVFFWDENDEIAPFGSEYGNTALNEFREWRAKNKKKSITKFLKVAIEDIGEMEFKEYTVKLLDQRIIGNLLTDEDYDADQLFDGLDISIIAIGFAQLADEGKIDQDAKRIIRIAIERQLIGNSLGLYDEDLSREFIDYLKRLKEVLEEA
jgi:uncharacterized protein YfeS